MESVISPAVNPGVDGDNNLGQIVGGVTKLQLLRGVRAQSKEKFPPFLVVPGLFFILWVLIVNATLHTAERQDTHTSIRQQFLSDSTGTEKVTGVQGKRNRGLVDDGSTGGADIGFDDGITDISTFWDWLEYVQLSSIRDSYNGSISHSRKQKSILVVLGQKRSTCTANSLVPPRFHACTGCYDGPAAKYMPPDQRRACNQGASCINAEQRASQVFPSYGAGWALSTAPWAPFFSSGMCMAIGKRSGAVVEKLATAAALAAYINASSWAASAHRECIALNVGDDLHTMAPCCAVACAVAGPKCASWTASKVNTSVANTSAFSTSASQENTVGGVEAAQSAGKCCFSGDCSTCVSYGGTFCSFNANNCENHCGGFYCAAQTVFAGAACTLFGASGSNTPPTWIQQTEKIVPDGLTCVSGQPWIYFQGFGSTWQCADPCYEGSSPASCGSHTATAGSVFSQPHFSAGLTTTPQASVRDYTFSCSLLDEPQDACVFLGDAFSGSDSGSEEIVAQLRRLNWLDTNTSSVTLQYIVKGPLDSFGTVTRTIDFTSASGVQPSTSLRVVLPTGRDIETLSQQSSTLVALAFFDLYLLKILYDMVDGARRHASAGLLVRYLREKWFWALVELVLLAAAVSFQIFAFMQEDHTRQVVDAYAGCNDGLLGLHFTNQTKVPCSISNDLVPDENFIKAAIEKSAYDITFETMSASRKVLYLAAVNNFLELSQQYFRTDAAMQVAGTLAMYMITLRMFRFFTLQPRLAIITRTLQRGAADLVHFMIIFLIVLFGFAACLWFNFGEVLPQISSFREAAFATFTMAFGSYDDLYGSMAEADVVSARFFLVPFLLLVVVMLINIFLAIILDAYGEVKSELQNNDAVPSVVQSSFDKLLHLQKAWQRNVAMRCLGYRRALASSDLLADLRNGRNAFRAPSATVSEQDIEMHSRGEAVPSMASILHRPAVDAATVIEAASVSWPRLLRALDKFGADELVSAPALRDALELRSELAAQIILDEYIAAAFTSDYEDASAAGDAAEAGRLEAQLRQHARARTLSSTANIHQADEDDSESLAPASTDIARSRIRSKARRGPEVVTDDTNMVATAVLAALEPRMQQLERALQQIQQST